MFDINEGGVVLAGTEIGVRGYQEQVDAYDDIVDICSGGCKGDDDDECELDVG